MLVDSHCHLDFPGLSENLSSILENMVQNGVTHAMCIGVDIENFHGVLALAEAHSNLYATVGVHPDYEDVHEPTINELVELAAHPKILAIGETGLDYYRLKGDLEWQRERFRTHIRAARKVSKPLVVHTREAADDTLRILAEECADEVGGIMHCFTENTETAKKALDLGFHISFSGIVTFKSAEQVREVVRMTPLERILIETDAPYLAPVPHRGKTNQPAFVKHVAEKIAEIKSISLEEVSEATSRNFFRMMKIAEG